MNNTNNLAFKHFKFQSANSFLWQRVLEELHFMLKMVPRNRKHLCLLMHIII